MKAIAEYFRDLAADDRYFGAEPPVPDAEMLTRIAEREIARRVEARLDANGIVLRAAPALPTPGPVAHTAAATAAAPAVDPVAARAASAQPVAAQPAPAQSPAPDTPTAAAQPLTPILAQPDTAALAPADPMPPRVAGPDAVASDMLSDAPAADTAATLPLTVARAPDMAAPMPRAMPRRVLPPDAADAATGPVDSDSIAAKLLRIRAVVGRQPATIDPGEAEDSDSLASDPLAGEAMAPVSVAPVSVAPELEAPKFEAPESVVSALLATDLPPNAGDETAQDYDDAQDTGLTAPLSALAPLATAVAAPMPRDKAHDMAAPGAPLAPAPEAVDQTATATADDSEPESIAIPMQEPVATQAPVAAAATDTVATATAGTTGEISAGPAAEPATDSATESAPAPIRARVIRMRRADFDKAVAAGAIASPLTAEAASPAPAMAATPAPATPIPAPTPAISPAVADPMLIAGSLSDEAEADLVAELTALQSGDAHTETATEAASDFAADIGADEDAYDDFDMDEFMVGLEPGPQTDTAIATDDDFGDIEAALAIDGIDDDVDADLAMLASLDGIADGGADTGALHDGAGDLDLPADDAFVETAFAEDLETPDPAAQDASTTDDGIGAFIAGLNARLDDAGETPAASDDAAAIADDLDDTARDLPAFDPVATVDIAMDDTPDAVELSTRDLDADDVDTGDLAAVDTGADIVADAAPVADLHAAEPARAHLLREPEVDSAALDRLLQRTEESLSDPVAKGRREALAHLKAAVAATEAARTLGEPSDDGDEVENAFRDDLRRVVRPRRPVMPGQAVSERPRNAPLKLVASQRVDLPRTTEAAVTPVRPRRVTIAPEPAPVAAPAPSVSASASASAAATTATGFAEFAEQAGAKGLQDLLEAAAAYTAYVEGIEDFSRPHLMKKVTQASPDTWSREDTLRSFGTLLRDGRILRAGVGRFQISEDSRFNPGRRAG